MPASSAENLLLLSRNPVFTAAKSVWGYEIQATSGMAPALASGLGESDIDVGAAVISGDYVGLKTIQARSKKMLLAYSAEQLEHLVPRALPPHCSVILVTPACQQDPALLPALQLMASEGHTVALEWSQRVTPSAPALDVASMLCLAAPEMAADPVLQDVLVRGADPAAGGTAKVCLVRGVATRCELENLLSLGITLFQGRFFKTAEIIPQ